MNCRILLIFLFFIAETLFPQSANWEWKSFTSTRQIRDIVFNEGQVWCATEGGLLLFRPETREFEIWTNTEGLASVDISAIAATESGDLWIGMNNGSLQKYNILLDSWFTAGDYQDFQISSFARKGDSLFIALNIGVSLYLISKNEVRETYKHLGENLKPEINVLDILINNNELWALTENGLTFADLSHPNLLDPQYWTPVIINQSEALHITAISQFENRIIAGTEAGLFVQDSDLQWTLLPGTELFEIVDFYSVSDGLYALSDSYLYLFQADTWTVISASIAGGQSLCEADGILFVGTKQGILRFSDRLLIDSHIPDGPGSNFFSDLTIDQDGTLWCCSADYRGSSGSGFYKYRDGKWTVFNKDNLPGLNTDLVTNIAVDHTSRKWIGTWGAGLAVMEDDTTCTFYRPQNGYLAGVLDNNRIYPDYCVVKGIAVDLNNTVWLLNRGAYNGNYLVSVTEEDIWTYYGLNDGLNSAYVWDITVDLMNRKWISTNLIGGSAQGVYLYDDRHTPTDKADDIVNHLSTGDGLLSGNIQSLTADADNTVWFGSDLGLNYIAGNDVREQYGITENIRALLIDGANNLWMGTNNGVCYLSAETYEWTCFNSDNSGLVHNEVMSLALDQNSGLIYIGTTKGLSQIKTPYSTPKSSFESLDIYPNPFILKNHDNVTIENLPKDVALSIMTSQGYLVYQKLSENVYGNTFIWNGTDMSGNAVSTGVYLVVVSSQSGEKRIGKLAVIR